MQQHANRSFIMYAYLWIDIMSYDTVIRHKKYIASYKYNYYFYTTKYNHNIASILLV